MNYKKREIVFSMLLFVGLCALTMIFVNGNTEVEGNHLLKFDFSVLEDKSNDLVDVSSKQVVFKDGIDENSYFEKFGLSVDDDFDFSNLSKFNVRAEVYLKKKGESEIGENHFYIGFSDFSQVAFGKNYLEVFADKNQVSFLHRGDDLEVFYSDEVVDFESLPFVLEYDVDKDLDVIKLKINAFGEVFEKDAKYSTEFDKGLLLDDFWLTVVSTSGAEFVVKNIEVNY